MEGTATSSVNERLLDSYTAFSQPRLDSRLLESVFGSRPGKCLWIGSYVGLVARLPTAPDCLLDLDHGVLRQAIQHLPGTPAVQADIRWLPFREQFDLIVAPGCVSAYLTTDDALQQAASALHQALRPGGMLYMDAYDSARILDMDYFQGSADFVADSVRWTRHARARVVQETPFLFDVRLCFSAPNLGVSEIAFRQRGFCQQELCRAFECVGLRVMASLQQPKEGRFACVFRMA
jgi:SAM-dependent methyltransferase